MKTQKPKMANRKTVGKAKAVKQSAKSVKQRTRKVRKADYPTEKPQKTEQEIRQKEEYDKANEERFYCKNANLLHELLMWKNSTKQGLPVYKRNKKTGRLVMTAADVNGDYGHEKYSRGTKYFIVYSKSHERYLWLQERNKTETLQIRGQKVVEDVTKIVEHQGYAFDIDDNEMHRTISENLGRMMIQIAEKVSNHSYFRNYSVWDKSEMQSYAYEKIIRGLPNYSFKFTNVFAYFTQACFNSFKSILSKHYKQLNIKRDMAKKAMVELQSVLPGSSMEKCLGNQFKGNDFDDFSEF